MKSHQPCVSPCLLGEKERSFHVVKIIVIWGFYNIQPNLILTNTGSHGLSDLKTMSDDSNICVCFGSAYVYVFLLVFII